MTGATVDDVESDVEADSQATLQTGGWHPWPCFCCNREPVGTIWRPVDGTDPLNTEHRICDQCFRVAPPAFRCMAIRRAAGSASESHSDAAGARAAPEDLQLEQALEQQALEEQALEQAFEQLDQRCHRGCQVNPRRHKEGWGHHCASASGLWRQNDTGSSIRMSGPLQDRQRSRNAEVHRR